MRDRVRARVRARTRVRANFRVRVRERVRVRGWVRARAIAHDEEGEEHDHSVDGVEQTLLHIVSVATVGTLKPQ